MMNLPMSNSSSFTLPLFPLPLFLLPDGVTRLRIFEPRYLKMVTIAAQNNGFAIMLNTGSQIELDTTTEEETEAKLASWVEIINFDQDESGVLLIDVQCKGLLEVLNINVDKDNLKFGVVKQKHHWLESYDDEVTKKLTSTLKRVFEQDDELNTLYQNKFVNNANWVLARWLELLPLTLDTKRHFSEVNSFEQAKRFVASVVFDQKND